MAYTIGKVRRPTTMHNYEPFIEWIRQSRIASYADIVAQRIDAQFDLTRWGDLPGWLQCLEKLPLIQASPVELNEGVRIGSAHQLTMTSAELKTTLMALHPWRKGPFELFGMPIDTEWRSNLKWERLLPHIQPLHGRLVMDVGCGNGYHCWRMLGAGAERVIGIDPSVKFVCQFQALKHFAGTHLPIDVLPLKIQQIPAELRAFDSVFSMGVLYHRMSPMGHLRELRDLLRPGGQLILETLIVDGPEGFAFVPEGRYAKMPNVWFLPSPKTLISWLLKIGFNNPRWVNESTTTPQEQRPTDWMTYHSLTDFLHSDGSGKTIEGHPPPTRGIFVAEAPF